MPEGIELATSTPQASIADATGNGDVDSIINSIILALVNAGIIDKA